MVLAGVVDENGRRIGLGRALEQILIEEWKQHVAAKLQRGIAIPAQRAKRIGLVVHLAVTPWTHHQIVHGVGGVLRLDGLVAVDRAPHVFLIP